MKGAKGLEELTWGLVLTASTLGPGMEPELRLKSLAGSAFFLIEAFLGLVLNEEGQMLVACIG